MKWVNAVKSVAEGNPMRFLRMSARIAEVKPLNRRIERDLRLFWFQGVLYTSTSMWQYETCFPSSLRTSRMQSHHKPRTFSSLIRDPCSCRILTVVFDNVADSILTYNGPSGQRSRNSVSTSSSSPSQFLRWYEWMADQRNGEARATLRQ